MNRESVPLCLSIVLLVAIRSVAAEAPNWAGEYANKKFLNGEAVFEISIAQSGNAIQVVFGAAYSDGRGAAPEGQGPAKITSKGTLAFKWKDSFKNSGTGTVTRAGDDIIVSMKTARVSDPRCLVFYGQKMRFKPTGKET
jgi:hypothetical protein